MWLGTQLRLWKTLREYQKNKNIDTVLRENWEKEPLLNHFFGEIRERLEGEETQKLQQKQAEYLALQNQINPHFLYNTLEAIRTDAILQDCPEIAETTEALSTFFRYTISNVQELVTLSDELDHIDNYFIVQKCRFGDKMNLETEMENERLLQAVMPKLILQPLVENAVGHGLERKMGKGTVKVTVENSDQVLFIRVRDDGVGINEEQLDRMNRIFAGEEIPLSNGGTKKKRGGIALRNVNSRIKLMFGDDYGLSIYSAEGIGTECCVTLPLQFGDAK